MKILLGMSGGIDSTYSALKLKEMGHTVEGVLLIMHDNADVDAAKESAKSVDIPLKIIDCRKDFKDKVIDIFASEYLRGRTPNPCIVCNSDVKFKVMCEIAKQEGFDKIATGHYAGIEERNGRYSITKGEDSKKDQSYVLWRLDQEILSMLMLPLTDSVKSEIKEKTKALNLTAAEREESQEICFIPDNNYASYIEKNYKKSEIGDFVDTDGNFLGKHKGIIHYTVGQRKGLGVALGERAFVSKIIPENNTIILSKKGDIGEDYLRISNIVFSGLEPRLEGEVEFDVKLRYLAPPIKAKVKFMGDVADVELLEKRVVTPGQSAVFYQGNSVMFGGFIR